MGYDRRDARGDAWIQNSKLPAHPRLPSPPPGRGGRRVARLLWQGTHCLLHRLLADFSARASGAGGHQPALIGAMHGGRIFRESTEKASDRQRYRTRHFHPPPAGPPFVDAGVSLALTARGSSPRSQVVTEVDGRKRSAN